MEKFLEKIAEMIEKIAEFGAGTASMGVAYEPNVPKELRETEE